MDVKLWRKWIMDIWERLYEKAKVQYHPDEISPFVYGHNVVCALEAENGEIYVGFCMESCGGVMNLCAERVAALLLIQFQIYFIFFVSGLL